MRIQRLSLLIGLVVFGSGCTDPVVPAEFAEPSGARDMSMTPLFDFGPNPDAGVTMPEMTPMDASTGMDMAILQPEFDAEVMQPTSDPACEEFAVCLAECQDPECARACRQRTPEDSAARYDAIYQCGTENACVDPGGVLNDECMSEACEAELLACYGPPPPPPPPPMGTLTCVELDECLRACTADDIDCRDGCVSESSPMGYEQLLELQACVTQTECAAEDEACLLADCENPIAGCFGSVAVPNGEFSCLEFNGCLVDCPEEDAPCMEGCARGASPEGYNQLQALLRCINETDCPAGDGDCQQMACPETHEACFGPPPPEPVGDMDCSALNDCLVGCEEGDDVCSDDCVARSSQQGYDTFVAAIVCIRNTECEAGDGDCQRLHCGAEIDACLGPRPEPMGNLSCAEINECLGTCPEGAGDCIDACIRQGSPAGWARLEAVYQCIEDAGCASGDAICQQANCLVEINTCFQ